MRVSCWHIDNIYTQVLDWGIALFKLQCTECLFKIPHNLIRDSHKTFKDTQYAQ